jgi:DNA-directed RNA polymerase specialized sigma24 family protein
VRKVSDAEIAAYKPTVERLANQLKGGKANAEFDDLVQEGLILVWKSLQAGIAPSAEMIVFRMKDWRRYLLRHGNNLSYDEVVDRDVNELAQESVPA